MENEKKNSLFFNRKAQMHNQMGILFQKNKKTRKAIYHFQKALELQEDYANAHYNLANAFSSISTEKTIFHFKKAILLRNDFVEAWTNLAVQYMKVGRFDEAYEANVSAIQINSHYSKAHFNYGVLLRRMGKQNEALEYYWNRIHKDLSLIHSPMDFKRIKYCKDVHQDRNSIHVVCVKWGTKYNCEYVNKLYNGIRKYFSCSHTFVCFTEDAKGLDPNIQVRPLSGNWSGWWNKADIFSSESQLFGKIVYIDLDTVITGSIDHLAKYSGNFAVLGTDDMYNEQRKQGYNTSIIIFQAELFHPIFSTLQNHFSVISQYIYKFDHWIEMMIPEADILQNLYKGKIFEFRQCCNQHLPETASIVCFPLQPKPHEYSAPWIKDYWK